MAHSRPLLPLILTPSFTPAPQGHSNKRAELAFLCLVLLLLLRSCFHRALLTCLHLFIPQGYSNKKMERLRQGIGPEDIDLVRSGMYCSSMENDVSVSNVMCFLGAVEGAHQPGEGGMLAVRAHGNPGKGRCCPATLLGRLATPVQLAVGQGRADGTTRCRSITNHCHRLLMWLLRLANAAHAMLHCRRRWTTFRPPRCRACCVRSCRSSSSEWLAEWGAYMMDGLAWTS